MKILASDYDNTLYVPQEDIFKKNIQHIKDFVSKDNVFIIITGRSYQGIKDDLVKYDIPYTYLICNDGAILFNSKDNCLKTETIDIEKIKTCQEILNSNNYKSYLEDGFKTINEPDKCIKIIAKYNDKQNAIKMVRKIKENVDVYAYVSTEHINIIDSHVNKCTGLENLLKIENLLTENIYVIGDEINDYEMLKKFKGVTMKIHSKELDALNLKEYKTLYEYIEELSKN